MDTERAFTNGVTSARNARSSQRTNLLKGEYRAMTTLEAAQAVVEAARVIYEEVRDAVRVEHEHGVFYTSAVGIRTRAKALGKALQAYDQLLDDHQSAKR